MRSRAGGGGRRMRGLAVGIVTNINDPEKMGRVKVKFPWLDDAAESNWARVTGWYAGASRGTMYIPEIDDEVIVAFDNGDPNHPYVVGAVWNGKHKVPGPGNADGKNDHKWFKSRAGHDLEFLDSDGAEKIRLVDCKAKNSFVMDTAADTITTEAQSGSITISACKTIQIDCVDFKITTSKDRGLTVGASHSVKVGASRSVTVSQGSFNESAGSSYSVTAASVSTSSSGHSSMGAGAMTMNSGSMKSSVKNWLDMTQSAVVTRTVGMQKSQSDVFATVASDGAPTGLLTLTSGPTKLQGDQAVYLKGKVVTLTGGLINLKGSSILIAKDIKGGKAALASFMGGLLMLNPGGITMPAAKMLDMLLGFDLHGPTLPAPVAPTPLPPLPAVPMPFSGPILLSVQPTVLVNFMPAAGSGALSVSFHMPPLPWPWAPITYGAILKGAIMALVTAPFMAMLEMARGQLSALAGASSSPMLKNGFVQGFLGNPPGGGGQGGSDITVGRFFPMFGSPQAFLGFLAQAMPLPVANGQATIASPTVSACDTPMALAMPMGGNTCSNIPVAPNAAVLGFSNVMTGMSLSQLLGVMAWNAVNQAAQYGLNKGVEHVASSTARRIAQSDSPALRNATQSVSDFLGGKQCIAEGHPVDVVSGTMFTEASDILLPGAQSLDFTRVYNSRARTHLKGDASAFGPGWRHVFDEMLLADKDTADVRTLALRDREGRILGFEHPVADGRTDFNAAERLTLRRVDGRTFEITDADGVVRVFRFPGEDGQVTPPTYMPGVGARARLVAVRAPFGGPGIQLVYTQDRLTEIVDAGLRRVRVQHDARGRVEELRLVESGGRPCSVFLASYVYDEAGRLVEHKDRNRNTRRYAYDARGRLARETDRNGYSFHFAYDDADRCIRTHGDDNAYWRSFQYEPGGRCTVVTNGAGHVTRYAYDEQFRVVAITGPAGTTESRGYTPEGWLAETKDALGRITETAYDERGRVTEVTSPRGLKSRTHYNTEGHLCGHTDPAGHFWPTTCDERGRVVTRGTPLGGEERFEYDAAGRVTLKIRPDGSQWRRDWSPQGLPLQDVYPDGTRLEYSYDLLGQVTQYRRVNRNGDTRDVKLSRDDAGRIVRVERPTGFTEHYDRSPEGEAVELRVGRRTSKRRYAGYARLEEHVDPLGRVTRYRYDLDQRIVAIEAEDGRSWTYHRDALGRLVGVRTPDGQEIRYVLDAAGQRVEEIHPDGRRLRRTFDENGNVVEAAWSGQAPVRYEYDAMDRLVGANAAGDRPVVRQYDAEGNLELDRQGDEALRFDYDAVGRATRRRTSWGHSHQQTFTGRGRLSEVTDEQGRAHRFERDAWGRRSAWRASDRLTRTWAWDELDRAVGDGVVNEPAGPVLQRELTWDDQDRVVRRETRSPDGLATEVYDFDNGGRLTGWRQTGLEARAWRYDTRDNVVGGTGLPDRDLDAADRLTGDTSGRSQAYDRRGRAHVIVTNRGRRTLWYDAHQRLRRVVTEDDRLIVYEYDAIGRRARTVAETENGVTEELLYWDGIQLARRVLRPLGAEAAAREETYVWDAERGVPLYRTVTAGGHTSTQLYVTDQRGAATHLLSPEGKVLWEGVYEPYGLIEERGPEAGQQPLRLAGQVHEPHADLSHHRFRVFDPQTQRFLTPDPLGYSGHPNAYLYPTDPVRVADPLGLSACNETFATREDAHNAALERAGIPPGQDPVLTWTVGNDPSRRGEEGYVFSNDPGSHGNYSQYETPNGSRVVAEHTGDPNAPGPHFHAGQPKGDSSRSGVDFGWSGDHNSSERYQQVDGKHHYYYPAS